MRGGHNWRFNCTHNISIMGTKLTHYSESTARSRTVTHFIISICKDSFILLGGVTCLSDT